MRDVISEHASGESLGFLEDSFNNSVHSMKDYMRITEGSQRKSSLHTSEIFVFLHPIEKTTNHLCQNTKTMLL